MSGRGRTLFLCLPRGVAVRSETLTPAPQAGVPAGLPLKENTCSGCPQTGLSPVLFPGEIGKLARVIQYGSAAWTAPVLVASRGWWGHSHRRAPATLLHSP